MAEILVKDLRQRLIINKDISYPTSALFSLQGTYSIRYYWSKNEINTYVRTLEILTYLSLSYVSKNN